MNPIDQYNQTTDIYKDRISTAETIPTIKILSDINKFYQMVEEPVELQKEDPTADLPSEVFLG